MQAECTGVGPTIEAGPHILIVDDDPAMQRMIVDYVSGYNMRATAVSTGSALLQALAIKEPDLIVLDLHLGGDDGLELLRELRTHSVVPVILITGHRKDEVDRVIGLELGADDYLTKPFSLRELLARTRATLRRRRMDRLKPVAREDHTYRFEGWVLHQRMRQLVNPKDEEIPITKGEFALLSAFVEAPRRTLSREFLLQATRIHEDVFDRSIDVQILRLRRKLEDDPREPRLIRTERGTGYIFDADVHTA